MLEFSLNLGKSHVAHGLKALEKNITLFPSPNIYFEFSSNGVQYPTYVDRAGRLRITYLLEDYPVEIGDELHFKKLGFGTVWDVSVLRGNRPVEPNEINPWKIRRRKQTNALKLEVISVNKLLSELAAYQQYTTQENVEIEGYDYNLAWFDKTGNPVWVFETFEAETIEKIKENSDAFGNLQSNSMIIYFSLPELWQLQDCIQNIIDGSPKRVLLPSWDFLGYMGFKMQYGFIDTMLTCVHTSVV